MPGGTGKKTAGPGGGLRNTLWRPPNGLCLSGQVYPIRTDLHTALTFAAMAKAGTLTEEGFYRLWFPAEHPKDLEQALEAVGAFYRQGRPRQESGPQAYDLLTDAGPIFAAFRRYYGMDLNTAGDMHWWHFLGLLEGLITHSFSQRVSYRVGDLKGLSPEQRAEVLRYRALYRLDGEEESLEEHLQNLQRLAKRGK